MAKVCEYVSRNKVKQKKQDVNNALNNMRGDFKSHFGKGYNFSMVGSAKRNLVVQKGNSNWDIDFQIRLNSKVFIEDKFKPKEIKEKVRDLLKSNLGKNYNVKLSTSVISISHINDKSVTFDVAIIRISNEGWEILRGKENIPEGNYFRWEKLKNTRNTNQDARKIKGSNMWEDFRDIYKSKKCIEFDKDRDDYSGTNSERKSSNAIYAETVNEVLQKYNIK